MKNQFFYTRTESIVDPVQPDKDPFSSITPEVRMMDKYYIESFNVDKVIRSVQLEDGKVLVLLNDIHERTMETPDINTKTNKVIGVKRMRNTYQSEIYLSAEDGLRFKSITEIE